MPRNPTEQSETLPPGYKFPDKVVPDVDVPRVRGGGRFVGQVKSTDAVLILCISVRPTRRLHMYVGNTKTPQTTQEDGLLQVSSPWDSVEDKATFLCVPDKKRRNTSSRTHRSAPETPETERLVCGLHWQGLSRSPRTAPSQHRTVVSLEINT